MSKANVKAAGLSADITIEQQDFKDFKGHEGKAIMVTNPPYGERISTPNLLETYKMIGERLKHAFKEGEAWILSYREECFQQIGLKPSVKIPLYNGSLECEYRKYSIFDGKLKNFREEGGVVKTEEEKRQMAEKRRTWQKRDYEKKETARIDNEEADILTFKFRSLEKQRSERAARERKAFSRDRKPYGENEGRKSRKDGKPFRRGETRSERQNNRKNFFGNRGSED